MLAGSRVPIIITGLTKDICYQDDANSVNFNAADKFHDHTRA